MTTTQLPVFRKMYDLNLMLIRLVNNFPKQYKYNVGSAATWTSSCGVSTYPCNWTVETASS